MYANVPVFQLQSELSKQFKETDAPRFFGFFENMLKENGTGFFVGSDVSLLESLQ